MDDVCQVCNKPFVNINSYEPIVLCQCTTASQILIREDTRKVWDLVSDWKQRAEKAEARVKELDGRIKGIHELCKIQDMPTTDYDRGLHNGLMCAWSCMTYIEPEYITENFEKEYSGYPAVGIRPLNKEEK